MARLDGKVAIVTGATGGLGRAFSVALASEGARIVATGRNVERGEQTVAAVQGIGGEAIFVRQDVTVDETWQEVIDRTIEVFGRLDVLINNAGDAVLKPLDDLTLDDLDFLLRLNLEGPFLGMKYAMKAMATGGGSIINISVLSALGGNVNSTAYSAAKGALTHMTRAAALAGAHLKVRVNTIVPGVLFEGGELSAGAIRVHGGREGAERFKKRIISKTPLGRLGEPEDAARAAIYLCSDEARHVTGTDLVVDGGRMAGGN